MLDKTSQIIQGIHSATTKISYVLWYNIYLLMIVQVLIFIWEMFMSLFWFGYFSANPRNSEQDKNS